MQPGMWNDNFMFAQFLYFKLIYSMTVNAGVKKDSEDDNVISVKQTFGAIRMLNVIVSFFLYSFRSFYIHVAGVVLSLN